jgi:hypothetical protein
MISAEARWRALNRWCGILLTGKPGTVILALIEDMTGLWTEHSDVAVADDLTGRSTGIAANRLAPWPLAT